MVRILECPRCGAGVGPNDSQCWRCGEMIRAQRNVEPPAPSWPRGATGIREARDITPAPKPKVADSGLHSLTEMQGGRYKLLQEREKELRQEMEALEEEARELDEAAGRLQEEEAELAERQRELDAREKDLDALALVIEPALQAVEELHRRGDVRTDALGNALEAARDLSGALEKERQRLRAKIEREMSDQLSRISQLEDELKAAHAAAHEEKEPEMAADIDVQDLIKRVAEQVDDQAAVALAPEETPFSTYIERLDQIMAGGIPRGSVILINGPGGSMKTTLAYHLLHHAAAEGGIRGMFFSLEQSRDSLIRQMEGLGMDRQDSLDGLMVADLVELRRSMEGQKGDWRDIVMRYVSKTVAENSLQLFVLDSFESFMALSERSFSRTEVKDLFDFFRDLGLTTVMISETPMEMLESNEHMELYVADGAIELAMVEGNDSRIQRWLRCIKLRGANIDTRYYCLFHQEDGFSLSPPMTRCPVRRTVG